MPVQLSIPCLRRGRGSKATPEGTTGPFYIRRISAIISPSPARVSRRPEYMSPPGRRTAATFMLTLSYPMPLISRPRSKAIIIAVVRGRPARGWRIAVREWVMPLTGRAHCSGEMPYLLLATRDSDQRPYSPMLRGSQSGKPRPAGCWSRLWWHSGSPPPAGSPTAVPARRPPPRSGCAGAPQLTVQREATVLAGPCAKVANLVDAGQAVASIATRRPDPANPRRRLSQKSSMAVSAARYAPASRSGSRP